MSTALYQHPDGFDIDFDESKNLLICSDGDSQIEIPIAPAGLAKVGKRMIAVSGNSHGVVLESA